MDNGRMGEIMSNGYIEMMKAQGWQVWVRPKGGEYCYCTDGKNICYVQWSRMDNSVSTVHVPSQQVGTGYRYADEITPKAIREAMVCFAPDGATSRDRAVIRKWADWNQFHNSSDWNREMVQA